jgi:hypothetical protein
MPQQYFIKTVGGFKIAEIEKCSECQGTFVNVKNIVWGTSDKKKESLLKKGYKELPPHERCECGRATDLERKEQDDMAKEAEENEENS